MIKFLVYVAIILTVLAVGYLVRVFELASSLKGKKPHEVTEKDNKLMGRLYLLALFALFGFIGWQLYSYGPRMLPISASEHGVDLDNLLDFNFAILWFVFIVTHILLFYFAFKYYGRDNGKATYLPHNNKLEMIWTVIPAIVLAVIVIYGIKTWNNITAEAPKDAIVIELYAKQFDWTARYAGKDNKLGNANYKLIEGANALGLDSTSVEAMDDIVVTDTLYLPVDTTVSFIFRSRDVIHSAYFPHFRAQMNCVPGMETYFHFKPTITTDSMRRSAYVIELMKGINKKRSENGLEPEEFNYILLCNKICGTSHYNMKMLIVVGTEKQYTDWMKRKTAFFGKKKEEDKKEQKEEINFVIDSSKVSK